MKSTRPHLWTGFFGQPHHQGAGPDARESSPLGRVVGAAGLLVVLLCGGCQTVHEVTIDAISNSQKQVGDSYRLEVIDPSGGVDTEVQAMAIATIKETLAARGLYEAPPGTRPDAVITYTYGVGHGHINIVTERNADVLIGPFVTPHTSSKAVVVYEKFIELSAREPGGAPDPARPGAPAPRGDELWNIKVTIVDAKNSLSPYLTPLASSAIDFIGKNSGKELHFKIEAKAAKALLRERSKPPAPPPPGQAPAK